MTGLKTNERPGTRAQVKYVRVSAYKARAVLDQIRGKSYGAAVEFLTFSERGVSDTVLKCLESAAANAEHNDGIPAEEKIVLVKFFAPWAKWTGYFSLEELEDVKGPYGLQIERDAW